MQQLPVFHHQFSVNDAGHHVCAGCGIDEMRVNLIDRRQMRLIHIDENQVCAFPGFDGADLITQA